MLFCVELAAQPSFHYLDKLTVKEGLSSNTVSDVVQDGNGFLWIATSYGLNRYDGTEVTRFFAEANDHSLPDNKINDMELLDSFHIAIATNDGLCILNTRDISFRNIYFNNKRASKSYDNFLTALSKDNRGNLWVASLSGVARLDKLFEPKEFFQTDAANPGFGKDRIEFTRKIISLLSGDQLFFSDRGVRLWNHATGEIQFLDTVRNSQWQFLKGVRYAACFQVMEHYLFVLKPKKLLVFDERTGDTTSCDIPVNHFQMMEWSQKISPLDDGWMAYSLEKNGVVYFNISDKNDKPSIYYDSTIHFANQAFRNWIKDNDGNWWITTDAAGLIKISLVKQLFKEKEIFNTLTQNVSHSDISGFYQDRNQFFIASYGDGLYTCNRQLDSLTQYAPPFSNSFYNLIWNIFPYRKNELWIGTGSGLLNFNLDNHKFSNIKLPHPVILDSFAITTSFIDSHGLVWMGVGTGHGICVFNPFNNTFISYPYNQGTYPFRYPFSIAEDRNSNLWFLSDNTHDFVTWNRKTNQFKIIKPDLKSGELNLPTGNLYLDKMDNIWFGMEAYGLIKYNIPSHHLETFGIDKGLNTDVIYDITEDKLHRLWLATNQGLTLFNKESNQFINYTESDGLPGGAYSSRFYYDSISKRMYIGAVGKIIYFFPEDFAQSTSPMNVKITRVFVNNTSFKLPENRELKLSSRQNDLTIYFTGINLTNGIENKYSYKFRNKDAAWTDIGNQRQLNFASLNPGTYEFIIRAARKDGKWSAITDHLSIVIKPPFTSTVWFYLVLLSVISGSIYAWYRYRLSGLMKLEKIRAGISHDLHDEIGSRLTNISMMSLLAQKGPEQNSQANEWLKKINNESRSVSQSMREIVWNINPDNDSLDEALPRMLRYISDMLEASGIAVQASVDELSGIKMKMEKRRDLFLIFKEAVQNIERHAAATNVKIRLTVKDKMINLMIADDGKGFIKEGLAFENGLKYMQQRAERNNWKITINSKDGQGTEVNLEIDRGSLTKRI